MSYPGQGRAFLFSGVCVCVWWEEGTVPTVQGSQQEYCKYFAMEKDTMM